MSTQRLNVAMREDIRDRIIRHKFVQEKNNLRNDRKELAEMAYNALYAKSIREKIAELPEGWLVEEHFIEVCTTMCGSQYLTFNGDEYWRRSSGKNDKIKRRFLHKTGNRYHSKNPYEDKLVQATEDLADKISDIESRMRKAEKDVMAVLNSATTANRLIEIWPEIEQFVIAAASGYVSGSSVPAPLIKDLNKSLSLPPKEKEAA